MEQERIWTLLGKKLSGSATETELQELELLLLAYDEDAEDIEVIRRLWESRQRRRRDGDSDAIRNRIDSALGIAGGAGQGSGSDPGEAETTKIGSGRSIRMWGVAAAAAVVLIGVCIGIFLRPSKKEKEDAMLMVFTRKKSHSNLRFPDGTTVVLNENSRISYNADFGRFRREIVLEGEAYFDVAANPGMPLVIHAGNVDIKVLGTSFNVRAYPLDKGVETSLISGAVEVSCTHSPRQKVLLRPNEKIIIPITPEKEAFDSSPGPVPVAATPPAGHTVDLPATDTLSYRLKVLQAEQTSHLIPEIAWMYRKLVFNEEPLETVAEKMERWYGVRFYFEDDEIRKEVFTGSFGKETLEEALKALQYSYQFGYVIKGNEVFIQRKK